MIDSETGEKIAMHASLACSKTRRYHGVYGVAWASATWSKQPAIKHPGKRKNRHKLPSPNGNLHTRINNRSIGERAVSGILLHGLRYIILQLCDSDLLFTCHAGTTREDPFVA